MMSKSLLVLLSGAVVLTGVSSSFAGGRAVECYERYHRAPVYGRVVEREMITPGQVNFEDVPAQYETQVRSIRVADETVTYQDLPAQHITVLKKVLVPGATVSLVVPAETVTRYRTVTVPGRYAWEKRWIHGKLVLCKIWHAGGIRKIAETVVVRRERVVLEQAQPQFVYVDSQVEVSPARTERIVRPAEFRTESDLVEVAPAYHQRVDIPAQYGTVSRKVLLRSGESGWKRLPLRGACSG